MYKKIFISIMILHLFRKNTITILLRKMEASYIEKRICLRGNGKHYCAIYNDCCGAFYPMDIRAAAILLNTLSTDVLLYISINQFCDDHLTFFR